MGEQKKKSTTKATEAEINDLPVVEESDIDVDDILDEIDEVLEENAQEFVEQYVQKGGE